MTKQSCVLNLPLDEGKGVEARDISGYANDGVLKHGSTWTQLASGLWVYTPDGAADYIEVPFQSQLNLPCEQISIECWVYLDRLSSVYGDEQIIVSKRKNGTTGYGMNIHEDTDSLRCDLKGLTDDFPTGAAPAMEIETWYHCVITYDGKYIRTYVNGVKQLEDASSGSIDNNDNEMWIGDHDDVTYFDGQLSRFRVYNYPLLDSTILAHHLDELDDYLAAYAGVTLALIRADVQRDLKDESAERWATTEVDRAVLRALADIDTHRPQELDTLLATTKNSRLVNISPLTDKVSIDAVEYPIDLTPKSFAHYEVRGNQLVLEDEGDGNHCRVYWTKKHSLSTTECTLPEELHDLLCLGASAYAVISQSQYQSDRANIGGPQVDRDYAFWGRDRLKQFHDELKRISRTRKLKIGRFYT